MRSLLWTDQARGDLAAIREFVSRDSAHYADIVVARLIAAVDRIARFPESGRVVPEFADASLREVIWRPYRIVYRLVGPDRIHIVTVHHEARRFPADV